MFSLEMSVAKGSNVTESLLLDPQVYVYIVRHPDTPLIMIQRWKFKLMSIHITIQNLIIIGSAIIEREENYLYDLLLVDVKVTYLEKGKFNTSRWRMI